MELSHAYIALLFRVFLKFVIWEHYLLFFVNIPHSPKFSIISHMSKCFNWLSSFFLPRNVASGTFCSPEIVKWLLSKSAAIIITFGWIWPPFFCILWFWPYFPNLSCLLVYIECILSKRAWEVNFRNLVCLKMFSFYPYTLKIVRLDTSWKLLSEFGGIFPLSPRFYNMTAAFTRCHFDSPDFICNFPLLFLKLYCSKLSHSESVHVCFSFLCWVHRGSFQFGWPSQITLPESFFLF